MTRFLNLLKIMTSLLISIKPCCYKEEEKTIIEQIKSKNYNTLVIEEHDDDDVREVNYPGG